MADKCPTCGRPLKFEPHPDKPGMLRAFCECNPIGPVVEKPAPEKPAPAEKEGVSK